jgi:hypothetical protein
MHTYSRFTLLYKHMKKICSHTYRKPHFGSLLEKGFFIWPFLGIRTLK